MARAKTTALTALLLIALGLAGCIQPKDRRPGLWLPGEVVSQPVQDWSFTDEHKEIYVQTRNLLGLAHSVTIVCTQIDGQLYIGTRNPTEKRWVGHLERSPDVRLGIGGKLYDQRLEVVEDTREQEAVYAAYRGKYSWPDAPPEKRT